MAKTPSTQCSVKSRDSWGDSGPDGDAHQSGHAAALAKRRVDAHQKLEIGKVRQRRAGNDRIDHDDADDGRSPLRNRARHGIGLVPELGGNGEDAGARLRVDVRFAHERPVDRDARDAGLPRKLVLRPDFAGIVDSGCHLAESPPH
ncbi:MAG: hypothetical protein PHW08_14545 [Kiritimatiellae bacterium]|nr:hypothetical protein [Kiritimatiellia bacterium]